MLWRERAPEVWDTGEPYLDLALAVTLRAKQDIMEAAKLAKAVLDDAASTEKRRKTYRAMKARKPESALWYFAASPVWHALCGQLSSGEIPLPPDLQEGMVQVLKALDAGRELEAASRKRPEQQTA